MIVAILLCSACVPSGDLKGEQALAPAFDPIAFFAGRTHGVGVLSIAFHKRMTTDVTGEGRMESDGSIDLDQVVKQGSKAAIHRQWRLHQLAGGGYAGTLTDASGPVRGEAKGNSLHLAFAMHGGLHADQWLYLQQGGQAAHNRMVITKLGVPVASLDETINRVHE